VRAVGQGGRGQAPLAARGSTERLDLKVYGDGDADLHALEVTDAVIQSSGDGETRARPTGKVDVEITGDGDVNLARRPEQLRQSVSGWGEVEQE